MKEVAIVMVLLQRALMGKVAEGLPFPKLTPEEWTAVYKRAASQGVLGIACEALLSVPEVDRPPKPLLLQWMVNSEKRVSIYEGRWELAKAFAGLLAGKEVRCVVLKGFAYAQLYPVPGHREFGDLDCFLMGNYALGNELARKAGAKVDTDGYKHSHIQYRGLTIENHQFLTSFEGTRRGKRTEHLLQRFLQKGPLVPLEGTELWCPSVDFTALFMVKHAQRHFITEGIALKQLCDWALFLQKEQSRVNWPEVYEAMEQCRMRVFAEVLTTVCREQLGVVLTNEAVTFSTDRALVEAFWNDLFTFHPSVFEKSLWKKILRICRRFRRMGHFRPLLDESYGIRVWNTFAYSSYLKRNPKL